MLEPRKDGSGYSQSTEGARERPVSTFPGGDSASGGEPEYGPDKVLPFDYGVPKQWYFPQVRWPIMLRCEYQTRRAFRSVQA